MFTGFLHLKQSPVTHRPSPITSNLSVGLPRFAVDNTEPSATVAPAGCLAKA